MKRYILYSICLLLCLFISCNDDRNIVPTGTLYLNVEEDGTMLTKAENEVTYESLQVVLLKGEEDTLKVYNDYLTEVKGERLVLPVGKYIVAVRSNGADGAGWETPLYMGQEEVEVKQGEITNTKVICTIANTKVSVIYDKSIKEHFIDYKTTVSNSSGELTFTRDEYRSGFFTPEKLTVQLDLTNNDGNKFTIKKVYPDIEPKYHYKFEFKISNDQTDEEAGADFDIVVDKEHKEITYPIFIKKEDLVYAGEPSLKLGGEFKEDGIYSFWKTEENQKPDTKTIWLDYTMGSENTLQSVIVMMDSPTLGVSQFDITKGEGSQIGLPALPESPVDTSDPRYKTYQMDLSAIVEHLECLKEQPTVHTFSVRLVDDKNQETSITFAIKMMPDVDAYIMEPYCWSTFAVLRGNSVDESCYFVLTTLDGDIQIQDQEKIVRDANGNMSVLITGLKQGDYSYKIVSAANPSVKTKKISFTIYDPTAGVYNVPNLGFEEWGTITKNKLDFNMGSEYVSPNNTDDFKQVYWESGNYGGTGTKITGSITVLAAKTEENATSSSKYAAKLTSKYAGLGSMGAFSAGSIFIGNPTKVSTGGAELKYGRPHIGFPTHLSGYYKYTPGSINYTNNSKGGTGTDKAIIYIALSTKPFNLKSLTNGTLIRFDKTSKDIFAYGEIIEGNTVKDYTHFDIPLIYLNNQGSQMPTYPEFIDKKTGAPQIYITIVATSSIDGDIFTGSTSSILYVDEFSLDYDYDAECFKGTEFDNMTPEILTTK